MFNNMVVVVLARRYYFQLDFET